MTYAHCDVSSYKHPNGAGWVLTE